MLLPKRTKFRRQHRGRLKGVSNANTVVFGEYGIQALEPVWLTSRQIEATRRTLTRYVRNNGKIWIRIFPDKPITERAAESRMGSGKGTVEYWVAVIKPGAILFEISGLDKETARKVLKLASYKLPIKTKIIEKI
uniref:Large ribosomal subunit protein uL16c n=1 Tax=Chrysochromulina tobinii TaxID=1460289 RepID=A0A075DWS5_9EUKA|nr:50S ribosomal protein L16 [Chrysochromulina tobinii]